MEERSGWGSALGTAWSNLTGVNNEGNIRVFRMLFFLIFIVGSGWAGWFLREEMMLMESVEMDEIMATPRPSPELADRTRLEAMIQQVEASSRLRESSPRDVELLESSLARYPFSEPRLDIGVSMEDFDMGRVAPEIFIDYPPEGITLRGIMIVGTQHVAVMDIPGVGSGMVVKVGDTFMQKKGRVVRIAQDKVVVNWGGKNWDIAPSF